MMRILASGKSELHRTTRFHDHALMKQPASFKQKFHLQSICYMHMYKRAELQNLALNTQRLRKWQPDDEEYYTNLKSTSMWSLQDVRLIIS